MYTSPPSPRDGAALPQSLVSCGRENVRFWRVKRQHLPGCPTSLNEYARAAEFTDLAFEASYGAGDESDVPKIVFVASKAGTLLQVHRVEFQPLGTVSVGG